MYFRIFISTIFLLLIECSVTAQTFSFAIPASFSTPTYTAARNGDYFFCSALSNARTLYCARIRKTGEVSWEKTFPVTDITPYISIQGTADNGLIVFSKDNNGSGEHYALLTKLDQQGNMQWAKRFQVGNNLIITAIDVKEGPGNEYILLYDVVEEGLFATERPQLAIFSKDGALVSQTGIRQLPEGIADDYFSEQLIIAENGDYIIGARVDYVDFEYSSLPKIYG